MSGYRLGFNVGNTKIFVMDVLSWLERSPNTTMYNCGLNTQNHCSQMVSKATCRD